MTNDILIRSFYPSLLRFSGTHTVGTVLRFEHPCIGYVTRGRGQFLYRGKSYYAKEGDLIYIAKGTTYYSVWTGTPEIAFYSVNFSFLKPDSLYEYRFRILKNYPRARFDEMYAAYDSDRFLSLSCFYRLLSELFRQMTPEENITPDKRSVAPAVDYIESHYDLPITIDTLAALCHSCGSGFFKKFKAATGVTPIAYKHSVMIQHALDLLSHTDLSVEAVGAKVGFSSSNYFRKVFFEITGKTPKEVR